MEMTTEREIVGNCPKEAILPVKDALEALGGKWKVPILISLSTGTKRFKEITKDVVGITDRMLSKELKDLEMNRLIQRTVHDTFPPTVEYSWTEHSRTLKDVIIALQNWGMVHRKKIIEG